MAFTVLKNRTGKKSASPLLYIEGGPGQSGIANLGHFLNHPLREEYDIILVDLRGTGNSQPKLCPDLGKEFLKIFAKNQSGKEDEKERIVATIACQNELLSKGIEVTQYNSRAIANDLNALKKALGYSNWNVLGVSYGTYVGQVYASNFQKDIRTLILDSPISEISNYYNRLNQNFIENLKKVIEKCNKDSLCSIKFPELEKKFYETINQLSNKPLSIEVDKTLVPEGVFTFNSNDFKIIVQQALYSKNSIEIIPTIIDEFHKENKEPLSALLGAFSGGLLFLDFGAYYCMTCNDAIYKNSVYSFDKNAEEIKGLSGGISFYRADFGICSEWDGNITKDTLLDSNFSNIRSFEIPVLIMSGEFDPITPIINGQQLAQKFNGPMVKFPEGSHVPSYSIEGSEILTSFISYPNTFQSREILNNHERIELITDITINEGITHLATNLSKFDPIQFIPFFIAILVIVIAIFSFVYNFVKSKGKTGTDKQLKILILVTSLIGLLTVIGIILGILESGNRNVMILAFGLQESYFYIFILQWLFLILTIILFFVYIIKIRKVPNMDILGVIVFSIILINIYYAYWGFFSFF
jgi:pimeloyl-ACP methyl ester carboxylesterase